MERDNTSQRVNRTLERHEGSLHIAFEHIWFKMAQFNQIRMDVVPKLLKESHTWKQIKLMARCD